MSLSHTFNSWVIVLVNSCGLLLWFSYFQMTDMLTSLSFQLTKSLNTSFTNLTVPITSSVYKQLPFIMLIRKNTAESIATPNTIRIKLTGDGT